jgi:hypothetical protein
MDDLRMKTQMGESGSSRKLHALNVSDALSRELKATYSKLLTDPVPEKFVELLKRLEDKEAQPDGEAQPEADHVKVADSDGK